MRHWHLVIMASAALLVACARGDDTAEMVRDTLAQADVGEVEVRREDGVIRLSGTTETLANRSRAEELARAIAGADVEIRNEIAVTGLGPLRRQASDSSSPEGRTP